MTTPAEASLSDTERRVLDRLVERLVAALGERLRSVWLYGSRARGEPPHDESDIDVLVVVDPLLPDDDLLAIHQGWEAVDEEGLRGVFLSTHVYGSERLAQRREIRSFFIQEVDRDKIVLFGDA